MSKRSRAEPKSLFDELPKNVVTHLMEFVDDRERFALFAAFPELAGDKIDWAQLCAYRCTPSRLEAERLKYQPFGSKTEALLFFQDCLFHCIDIHNALTRVK